MPSEAERFFQSLFRGPVEADPPVAETERDQQEPTDEPQADETPLAPSRQFAPGEKVILQPGHPLANFEWDAAPPVRVNTEPTTWEDADRELVDWFRGTVRRLPTHKFERQPGKTIVDPRLFYASLARDIAGGPRGPRVRTGALQSDLRQLRQHFESSKPQA